MRNSAPARLATADGCPVPSAAGKPYLSLPLSASHSDTDALRLWRTIAYQPMSRFSILAPTPAATDSRHTSPFFLFFSRQGPRKELCSEGLPAEEGGIVWVVGRQERQGRHAGCRELWDGTLSSLAFLEKQLVRGIDCRCSAVPIPDVSTFEWETRMRHSIMRENERDAWPKIQSVSFFSGLD